MMWKARQRGVGCHWLLASQCLAVLAVGTHSSFTRADTIDFGLPLEEVTVLDVRGGEITFLRAGATLTRSLETVEAIYFDELPGLRQAELHLSEGEYEEAIPLFEDAWTAATTDVQKLWLDSRLALAHGQAGRPAHALTHLARVVSRDADSHWLLLVPAVDAMSATSAEIDAARVTIARIKEEAPSPVLETLETVLDRIPLRESESDRPDDTETLAPNTGQAPPPPELRFASVREHVSRGESAPALTAIRRLSLHADKDDLPELFFHAGAALRGASQPAEAGLCYLRIAAHFPDSPWAARGLLATAEIYWSSFRDSDTATRLAQRALDLATRIDHNPLQRQARTQLDNYARFPSRGKP
jgi:tetratricopeptide (TPR) repeat protein